MLGAGDGNIKQTDFLGLLFLRHLGQVVIQILRPQVQQTMSAVIGLMAKGRRAWRRRPLPGEGAEDDGKFKAFTFMNRHDGDGVIVAFQPHLVGIGRVVRLHASNVQPLNEFTDAQCAIERSPVQQFRQVQQVGEIALSPRAGQESCGDFFPYGKLPKHANEPIAVP